ncbi:MAG: hypothetical protein UEJ45_09030 [Peptococcaceae bacterium]|nr:hypothetical protein [Peptococcaceae bacterium]
MLRPKFMDSEYLVKELFNLHLKEGAPEEVVRAFEAWKKSKRKIEKKEYSKIDGRVFVYEVGGGFEIIPEMEYGF